MKIKNRQLVTYGAATILATGFCAISENSEQVLAEKEPMFNQASEINQLNKQLNALKEEVKASNTKKNQLIESLAVLEDKEKNLSTLIQENEDKNHALVDTIAKLEETKHDLSQKLSNPKNEIEQTNTAIVKKETILAKFTDELEAIEKNIDTSLSKAEKSDLEMLEKSIATEKKKLADTIELRSSALESIKSQEANIHEYEETLIELKKNPEENSNHIFTINSMLDRSKDLLKKAQKTLNARNKSISVSETKIKEYQQQIDDIQTKVSESNSTVELQNKIDAINQEINVLNMDNAQYKAQTEELSKEFDQITTQNQQNDLDLKALADKINSLKQEHENIVKEINDNQIEHQDIENKELQLKAEILTLQSKITELNIHDEQNNEVYDNSQIINVPENSYEIVVPSTPVNEVVKEMPKQDEYVRRSKAKKVSAIKFKNKTFLIKIGKKWVKVKPAYLTKYLDHKYYKLKLSAKVKGKRTKIRIFDTKGKKTKHTIKRGKTIKVRGLKVFRKHIYMYIGNGKYISINNVKL